VRKKSCAGAGTPDAAVAESLEGPQGTTDGRGLSAGNRFDWSSDESVVCRGHGAIAVYFNRYGQIVIRQEDGRHEDDDRFVIVNRESLRQLIAELIKIDRAAP
jgi:hypothetical protein